MKEPKRNMYQKAIFAEYLEPVRLKTGKDKCPCCGKLMRAYAKTMDKRLVELGYDILNYLGSSKFRTFRFLDIWKEGVEDHRKVCDAQKLHYWNILKRTKKGNKWYVTKRGVDFLTGKIQIPKIVWTFNNEVILEEDVMVHVGNVDDRWQKERADYTFDYVPYEHKKVLKIS